MAILWADNFDNYGNDESYLLDGIYAERSSSVHLVTDPDAGATGNVIRLDDASDSVGPRRGSNLRMVYPNGGAYTQGFAFRVWFPALPESANAVTAWTLSDVSNTGHVTFKVETDGSISSYTGDISTGNNEPSTKHGTSSPIITAGAWHHVEGKVFCDASAGTIELRVNGVTVLNQTGLDTQNAATDIRQILFFNFDATGGLSPQYYIKDLILWDTTGTTNNDFLGTCHVYTLTPDGDTSFNWTASTGSTGYNLIDETTPDDADYISANDTPPAASTFSMSDLPPDIVSVKAVIPVVRAKKIDGGDGNIQTGLTVNAATDLGSDRPITTAFTYWWDVSELSPDTGLSWTPTEVNNVTFQIDRTI